MDQAPILKEQITQYLPERPVIVEAGAHIGRDTVKMAQLWPSATIHAFEPVLNLYEQLCQQTEQYPVHCYNTALSNHSGTEKMYISSGASTAVSSFFTPNSYYNDDVIFKEQMVPTITLDDWAQQNGIPYVDFMWLDMQGAEQKVLEAAQKILPTVHVIVVEVSFTERFKGIPLFEQIVAFMKEHGLAVIQQDIPRSGKCNILCVRPELL